MGIVAVGDNAVSFDLRASVGDTGVGTVVDDVVDDVVDAPDEPVGEDPEHADKATTIGKTNITNFMCNSLAHMFPYKAN